MHRSATPEPCETPRDPSDSLNALMRKVASLLNEERYSPALAPGDWLASGRLQVLRHIG